MTIRNSLFFPVSLEICFVLCDFIFFTSGLLGLRFFGFCMLDWWLEIALRIMKGKKCDFD